MVEHDDQVGRILKYLDDNGLADNTIVVYSTDNGPHYNMWPDGAITPYRSEKETNWEGAYRVPAMVRWPKGNIKGGKTLNGLMSHLDWFPTIMSAAGDKKIVKKLKKGNYKANGKSFKVHLDGYDQLSYLQGKSSTSQRKEFVYFNADAEIVAVRYDEDNYSVGSPSANFSGGGGVKPNKKRSIDSLENSVW